METRPIRVLLVEDDPVDSELTIEVLQQSKLKVEIESIADGETAEKYLLSEQKNNHLPDLILLDLNLPKKNGKEVLRSIKKMDTIKKIPVVILTSSTAAIDIQDCYKMGASCYVTKPVGMEEFIKVVGNIEDFWFKIVKLPKE